MTLGPDRVTYGIHVTKATLLKFVRGGAEISREGMVYRRFTARCITGLGSIVYHTSRNTQPDTYVGLYTVFTTYIEPMIHESASQMVNRVGGTHT